MRIFITGANGQLGKSLVINLQNFDVISFSRSELDITNFEQIKKKIDQTEPELIINAAAYTNVEKAELQKDLAFKINSEAVEQLALIAKNRNIPIIHFSTDYVFDGKKKDLYIESDLCNPINVYGLSKYSGEEKIKEIDGLFYIFRISWVYSEYKNNFFQKIKDLSFTKKYIEVVDDEISIPCSVNFISTQIKKIINKIDSTNIGLFHLVPNKRCSRYIFAKEIIRKYNPDFPIKNLIKADNNSFDLNARRPKYSSLDNSLIKKTFMLEFNDWIAELKKL